jgi:hypothetical protein
METLDDLMSGGYVLAVTFLVALVFMLRNPQWIDKQPKWLRGRGTSDPLNPIVALENAQLPPFKQLEVLRDVQGSPS